MKNQKAEEPKSEVLSENKVEIDGEASNNVVISGNNNVFNFGGKETKPNRPKNGIRPKKTKTSKINPIITVALITLAGTIITALLNSPLVVKLFDSASASPTTSYITLIPPAEALPVIVYTPEMGYTMVDKKEVPNIGFNLKTLGQLANENYSSAELNKTNNTLTFTIEGSPDMSALWRWYWCAANREILDRNMKEIDMRFTVNSQEIPRENFAQLIFKNKDSIFKDWLCFTYETVLKDWKPGVYQFKQTETFKSQINDGRDTFPAGYKSYEYIVSISQ